MFLTRTRSGVALAVLVAAVATGCSDDDSRGDTKKEDASEFAGFCRDFQAQDPHDGYKEYKRAIGELWKTQGKEAVPPSVRSGWTTYVDIVKVAFTEPGYEALLTDLGADDKAAMKAFDDFVAEEC